jgi:hypothetical protein
MRRLIRRTGEELFLNAYFKGDTTPFKTEMEKNSRHSWAVFMQAMEDRDWAKASAAVARPKA